MKVCCRVTEWRTAKKDSRRGLMKDCLSSLQARKSCVLPPGENLAEVWIWSKFHEG